MGELLLSTRAHRLISLYGLAALLITWPSMRAPGTWVPGAERSDLWDSLWSLWYVRHAITSGESLLRNDLLNFPEGGSLLVTDLLNGLLALPLGALLGTASAWSILVFLHLLFSGVAAHRLAELLGEPHGEPSGNARATRGWVAGIGYMAAPVLISAIHNGTSECVAGGWLPLALILSIQALRKGGWRRVLLAAAGLALNALASWYAGVCGFVAVSALMLLGEGEDTLRRRLWRLGPVLLLAMLPLVPWALLTHLQATRPDNLVGIKNPRELSLLRRSTGSADPLGWFIPGDYRSPDFRALSRYGEDFIHSHYLGFTLILGTLSALRRGTLRRARRWLVLASLTGAILAMGPVASRMGQAIIFLDDRALPLPYILLERLPGFSELSILFRLAQLPALGLALLADEGVLSFARRRGWLVGLCALLVFLELRLLSPVRGLPALSRALPDPSLFDLAKAPAGGVMNFPVAGGRPYLYEQSFHGKPIAGSLNFPNNFSSKATWQAILEAAPGARQDPEAFRQAVSRQACKGAPRASRRPGAAPPRAGVRYLVVHADPFARPDMHDLGVEAVSLAWTPLSWSDSMRVYDLCAVESSREGTGGPP